jgi:hypothetical protein
MKITKQVLKKMIKEELKQVQTNEVFGLGSKGEMDRAVAGLEGEDEEEKIKPDAMRTEAIRERTKALKKAYTLINTRPEFFDTLQKWLEDMPNMKPQDIIIALRAAIKEIMAEKGKGQEPSPQKTGQAETKPSSKAGAGPSLDDLKAALPGRPVTKAPLRGSSTGI